MHLDKKDQQKAASSDIDAQRGVKIDALAGAIDDDGGKKYEPNLSLKPLKSSLKGTSPKS